MNEKIDKLNDILKELKINYIQLHGNENDEYIKYLKKNRELKIIKSIQIENSKDFQKTKNYQNVDYFLFDYKPSKNELPGGNAKKFDWKLIKNLEINKLWFLSGGININNINDISRYIIPYGIDISSGVEIKPGVKSNKKIETLVKAYEPK